MLVGGGAQHPGTAPPNLPPPCTYSALSWAATAQKPRAGARAQGLLLGSHKTRAWKLKAEAKREKQPGRLTSHPVCTRSKKKPSCAPAASSLLEFISDYPGTFESPISELRCGDDGSSIGASPGCCTGAIVGPACPWSQHPAPSTQAGRAIPALTARGSSPPSAAGW